MKVQTGSGMNWIGLLGIIFVLCKIFEVSPIVDWSWWLVLMPFWIGLAIVLGIMATAVLVGVFAAGSVLGGAAIADWWNARKAAKSRQKARRNYPY